MNVRIKAIISDKKINYEKKTGLINNENKALEREEGFQGVQFRSGLLGQERAEEMRECVEKRKKEQRC